jgi:AbrB family looped-hinge helix DNA binding protein
MTVTIDKAGRIALPKGLLQRLGLRPNATLEIVEQPDGLLLRVPKRRSSLRRINGLLVHSGHLEVGADLGRLLDSVREERLLSCVT